MLREEEGASGRAWSPACRTTAIRTDGAGDQPDLTLFGLHGVSSWETSVTQSCDGSVLFATRVLHFPGADYAVWLARTSANSHRVARADANARSSMVIATRT